MKKMFELRISLDHVSATDMQQLLEGADRKIGLGKHRLGDQDKRE